MSKHSTYPLAIHVLFHKDNQVLLSLRANTGYEDGKYSVVAGHVETGESVIDAGIREAKEEAGVDVTPFFFRIVGSMHRKSEDERIDYFAVVDQWTGELRNCEKNKCGGLHWYPVDGLPSNIIPYIRFVINKTFVEKKEMWYEEFGWNTYHELEGMRRKAILENRGIISGNETLVSVYQHITDSIYDIDCALSKNGNSRKWIGDFESDILSRKILIGTSILRNFNSYDDCVLSACTTIIPPLNHRGDIVYGELERLLEAQLKMGMGVGMDLSVIAEPDKAVCRIDKILYRIDRSLRDQKRRPVAVMLTLKSSHPRINEFIKSRMGKDSQTTKLNISVFIDGKMPLCDIKDNITDAIISSGEPGLLFSNRIEMENDTPQWKYSCTAPCAEVAMSDGDACHFSYLNIAGFLVFKDNSYDFNEKEFVDNIYTLVRFLDDIVEYSIIHCSKDKYYMMQKKRRIGVGIAGFATALVKMGIAYNSAKGVEFAKWIAQLLAFHTKKASVELAIERGAFPAFDVSLYKEKSWLEGKFKSLGDAGQQLITDILFYGIRNATTLAFPPTGTSSQIAGVSPSFEPYLDYVLTYDGHKCVPSVITEYINKCYAPVKAGELIAQLLRNEVDLSEYKEFITATQVDIDMQLAYTKVFQDVSDGSASKTINLPESASKEDILDCIKKAETMGLKGIAIYKNTSNTTQVKSERCPEN